MGWFEKKVECEVLGSDGKPKKVKVSEKQFNQWKTEGKIRRVDCQVHILGVVVPYSVETWIIGSDISQEMYDRFKDENGHLYAVSYFKEGKPETSVTRKELWDKHRRDTLPPPQPDSMEEYFNRYHGELLSLDVKEKAIASITIRTLWHAFNENYPDINAFRKAPEAEKVDYLKNINEVVSKIATDEMMDKTPKGGSLGAALVQLYLAAIAKNDATMINRVADALEPFNKMAYNMEVNSL